MQADDSKRFATLGATIVGAMLVAIVAVYAEVAGHAFLAFDDSLYVTRNLRVQQGLSLQNLQWALVTTDA